MNEKLSVQNTEVHFTQEATLSARNSFQIGRFSSFQIGRALFQFSVV